MRTSATPLDRIARTFDRGPLNQIIEGADRHVVHNERRVSHRLFRRSRDGLYSAQREIGQTVFSLSGFQRGALAAHGHRQILRPLSRRSRITSCGSTPPWLRRWTIRWEVCWMPWMHPVRLTTPSSISLRIMAARIFSGSVQLHAAARRQALPLRGRRSCAVYDALAGTHQARSRLSRRWSRCSMCCRLGGRGGRQTSHGPCL